MPQPPKILTRRRVEHSRLFKVEAVELEFSNGERREYEYLLAGQSGAVIIVAMINANEALVIREFGIGINGYEWGLPKGKIDAGETPADAANRELAEEAGFAAHKLDLIGQVSQSPNYMQHQTHIVIARELYEHHAVGDEPEPMELARVNMGDLHASIADLGISEARSIAALYLARDWLAQR